MTDPHRTAARRRAVLDGWAASPTRFREDANAEDDLVLGGYADRLLVELAQNASDAALRAGTPGVLTVRLADGVLRVANTGAPLDAAGIDALTSLRASAKRGEGTAGRFGVGFSAVLAVSDAPEVRSTGGGVAFSAVRTAAAVADLGGVPAAEAARRDGRVPVLRLAWPTTEPPSTGDTEVVLPLRDSSAEAQVTVALEGFDPALLLGLPGLSTVDLCGTVLTRRSEGDGVAVLGETRWRYATASGDLPPDLLDGRPVEERERRRWSVLVAVPVSADGVVRPLAGDQVVHAPTPSDEPLSVPVRLVADFPLSPDRRRVPAGPLTDFVAERSGEVLADLVATLADDPSVLALLPQPRLAAGAVDAAVAGAAVAALAGRPWLPGRTVPRRALAVDDPLVAPLSDALDGVLPAGWWTHRTAPALRALGVRRLGLAEVVDAIAGLDREARWFRGLYAALGDLLAGSRDAGEAEALAALRVPLAGGATVTGARGLLLPGDGLPAEAVAALGLRVVHPDAVHPLLERLGARLATPVTVLDDPRVRAEVAGSLDADDPGPIAEAVLALVAAAPPAPRPWLADLALPGTDGDWWPAGELLVPGGALAAVVADDAPFGTVDPALVDRYGVEAVAAAGALVSFPVLDAPDVDLADVASGDDPGLAVDGGEDWADAVDAVLAAAGVPAGPVTIDRFRAVRDLEWVRPDAWEAALALLPRDVLAAGCTVGGVAVPAYTRWWLSRRPVLGGRRPGELRLAEAADLAGLYDVASGDLAPLLGVRTGLDDVLADPDAAADLLERLGDPARTARADVLGGVYARLAAALAGVDVDPPARIRVAPDRVVDARRAVVLDAPWLLHRLGDRVPVGGGGDPGAVADLLDVPLLSELA
ncbi:MAG TPA: ATP-binding protein [Mycobacteriales bacterium]